MQDLSSTILSVLLPQLKMSLFQLKITPLLMPGSGNNPADGWGTQQCTHGCEWFIHHQVLTTLPQVTFLELSTIIWTEEALWMRGELGWRITRSPVPLWSPCKREKSSVLFIGKIISCPCPIYCSSQTSVQKITSFFSPSSKTVCPLFCFIPVQHINPSIWMGAGLIFRASCENGNPTYSQCAGWCCVQKVDTLMHHCAKHSNLL